MNLLPGVPFLTEHGKRAALAPGIPGGAAVPAKQDDAVAEIAALFRGQNGTKLLFHLFRFFSMGKPQTAADTDAVGVADDTAGDGIEIAQKKVGGLSAYAGQFQ